MWIVMVFRSFTPPNEATQSVGDNGVEMSKTTTKQPADEKHKVHLHV